MNIHFFKNYLHHKQQEYNVMRNLPSRVNPDYLTPEKLKEAASKIKWDDEFYKDFFKKLPKMVEYKIRSKNESLGEVLYKKHNYKILIYILTLSASMALILTLL